MYKLLSSSNNSYGIKTPFSLVKILPDALPIETTNVDGDDRYYEHYSPRQLPQDQKMALFGDSALDESFQVSDLELSRALLSGLKNGFLTGNLDSDRLLFNRGLFVVSELISRFRIPNDLVKLVLNQLNDLDLWKSVFESLSSNGNQKSLHFLRQLVVGLADYKKALTSDSSSNPSSTQFLQCISDIGSHIVQRGLPVLISFLDPNSPQQLLESAVTLKFLRELASYLPTRISTNPHYKNVFSEVFDTICSSSYPLNFLVTKSYVGFESVDSVLEDDDDLSYSVNGQSLSFEDYCAELNARQDSVEDEFEFSDLVTSSNHKFIALGHLMEFFVPDAMVDSALVYGGESVPEKAAAKPVVETLRSVIGDKNLGQLYVIARYPGTDTEGANRMMRVFTTLFTSAFPEKVVKLALPDESLQSAINSLDRDQEAAQAQFPDHCADFNHVVCKVRGDILDEQSTRNQRSGVDGVASGVDGVVSLDDIKLELLPY